MSEVKNTEPIGKSSITAEQRLEQRRKALEKANAVRSEKASLKKREKEIQKKVYEQYKEDLEKTERKVFKKEVVPEPEGSVGEIPPPVDTVAREPPVKHIKIKEKRNKKVLLEWSDSDSEVDDEAIQRAFKSGYKKKPVETSSSKPLSREDYEKTLLQARYGETVKRVMADQIEKQKDVVRYYHGY